MTMKSDKNFGEELTCCFKIDKRNLAIKNIDFILESKIAELNQNKNSKQRDWPDVVWKFYFVLELNK